MNTRPVAFVKVWQQTGGGSTTTTKSNATFAVGGHTDVELSLRRNMQGQRKHCAPVHHQQAPAKKIGAATSWKSHTNRPDTWRKTAYSMSTSCRGGEQQMSAVTHGALSLGRFPPGIVYPVPSGGTEIRIIEPSMLLVSWLALLGSPWGPPSPVVQYRSWEAA